MRTLYRVLIICVRLATLRRSVGVRARILVGIFLLAQPFRAGTDRANGRAFGALAPLRDPAHVEGPKGPALSVLSAHYQP
jgi:hypothetical protein